jgi:hypothetical protein
MDRIEYAIHRARKEFEQDGLLSLTTVMRLNALGLDVPSLEEQFANS